MLFMCSARARRRRAQDDVLFIPQLVTHLFVAVLCCLLLSLSLSLSLLLLWWWWSSLSSFFFFFFFFLQHILLSEQKHRKYRVFLAPRICKNMCGGELPEPLANLSRAEDFARKVLPTMGHVAGQESAGKEAFVGLGVGDRGKMASCPAIMESKFVRFAWGSGALSEPTVK